jgi:hypothetical protein
MNSDQLPSIIPPGALATPIDGHLVPALIADLGDPAAWRYIEFFTANIRNPNTRRAYGRACKDSQELWAGGRYMSPWWTLEKSKDLDKFVYAQWFGRVPTELNINRSRMWRGHDKNFGPHEEDKDPVAVFRFDKHPNKVKAIFTRRGQLATLNITTSGPWQAENRLDIERLFDEHERKCSL